MRKALTILLILSIIGGGLYFAYDFFVISAAVDVKDYLRDREDGIIDSETNIVNTDQGPFEVTDEGLEQEELRRENMDGLFTGWEMRYMHEDYEDPDRFSRDPYITIDYSKLDLEEADKMVDTGHAINVYIGDIEKGDGYYQQIKIPSYLYGVDPDKKGYLDDVKTIEYKVIGFDPSATITRRIHVFMRNVDTDTPDIRVDFISGKSGGIHNYSDKKEWSINQRGDYIPYNQDSFVRAYNDIYQRQFGLELSAIDMWDRESDRIIEYRDTKLDDDMYWGGDYGAHIQAASIVYDVVLNPVIDDSIFYPSKEPITEEQHHEDIGLFN